MMWNKQIKGSDASQPESSRFVLLKSTSAGVGGVELFFRLLKGWRDRKNLRSTGIKEGNTPTKVAEGQEFSI